MTNVDDIICELRKGTSLAEIRKNNKFGSQNQIAQATELYLSEAEQEVAKLQSDLSAYHIRLQDLQNNFNVADTRFMQLSERINQAQNELNIARLDLSRISEEREIRINELNDINAKLTELSKKGVTQDSLTKVQGSLSKSNNRKKPLIDKIKLEAMLKNGNNLLFKNRNQFTVTFVASVISLIIGLFVQWYPTYVISGLNDSLNQPNLPIETIWKLQGSLNWWNVSKITIFQPVSILLSAGGIILLAYAITYIYKKIQFLSKH